MSGHRAVVRLCVVLAALALSFACGDGTTEPPPPPEPARPTTVTVSPATAELTALGASVQLSAEVRDQNGNVMTGTALAWSSSDASTATVAAAGLVTATGDGTVTITATAGSVSGIARIVVEQAVAAIRVSPSSLALPVGDTTRLSATALDALGSEVPDAAFEWRSSDATIATVDDSGLVRAEAVGAATITAASGALADSSRVSVLSDDPSNHHAVLTAGLPERPFVNATVGGTEGSTETVGTLRLGLSPDAFPVIVSEGDMPSVLVAASRLGAGRVVAFPGQDFLSPGNRATLLGNASAARLLANAVRWTGAKSASLRVLVDNRRVADALEAQGIDGVEVVDGRGPYVRDWSASALADADVAVVLANDWGTAHLVEASVGPLRAFVERGGGLVVAASALHWSWWIEQHHGPLTADALLRDTGISWNEDSIEEIASATTSFDLRLMPHVVWGEYIGGGSLDAFQTALLPGLFNTVLELGRTEELDLALARLVRETPALPTSSTAPEARLAAEIAETLGPHEWPETHPWAAVFPGLPAEDAHRVEGTVTVDASRSEFPANASRRERHLPLGFYAPPSALVTIEVPASHATGELAVSVGELHDNLGQGYAAQSEWRRAPWLRREFPVVDPHTAVTAAYGGSIALMVPADYSGTIPVTIRGAIPMAVYTAGESNAAEWRADLDGGAPQAIIQKAGGIRFVISAESARGIDDPGEVSAFWDGFQQHHAELSGEPTPRAYESIWIFDPQVGHGYANAGRLRINYPLHGEAWVLVPGTAEGRAWLASLPSQGPTPHRIPPQTGYSPAAHGVDWWLFGHELGHQWQSEDWTGHGITEVGVNLFTMYALNYYLFSGDDYNVYTEQKTHGCAAPLDHAALANQRWSTAGDCEKLALYRQLIAEFGWGAMKAVFHSYYDPAYPRSTYGGVLDGFAIRFSAIAQRDLVAFFRHWEYPLSESAAETIRSFGFEEWLPPGW
ncbi:MAG: M60 family metallopeptidase [Gemmatimonadetes bacterium]|nr:M60 family metallopeptidase [Gemmatimonadota bacterium]